MKNLVNLFINVFKVVVLLTTNRAKLKLIKTCASLHNEDAFDLDEESMTAVYQQIAPLFKKAFKMKNMPELKFKELPGDVIGLYDYADQTVSFDMNNLQRIVKNSFCIFCSDTDLLILYLLHELRHAWQYQNLKDDYTFWTQPEHRNVYASLYESCPLEIDANRFAQSFCEKDNTDVFKYLPLSLYQNYASASRTKEEVEASRAIDTAIATFKKIS